jgi:uncharacterized repeat protein (TIGR03806 family)
MKKHYIVITLLLLSSFAVFLSCGSDDSGEYKEVSPVVLDLSAVPYPKLSDYKFFIGEMKNLEPAYKVLPYDLNSSLFSDYALKKRFVWMPEGVQATYSSDGEILNFPTGTILIKNFYYDDVAPDNSTKIIETRLMIKRADKWIFATYVWNDEQTEAFLDMAGSDIRVTANINGEPTLIKYRIPSEVECATCHKLNDNALPIGPKPQNLFKNYQYADGVQNQLEKWKKEGYLGGQVPTGVTATIDWADTTKPLSLRARSYLDINCAHCHRPGTSCGDMPMNLAFNQTEIPANFGMCVEPHEFVTGDQQYIIDGQDVENSLLYFRVSTVDKSEMMPNIGRSVIHNEGVILIEEWINSMQTTCP